MTKSLIIAEKPSVAQDIVRALTPAAGKFDKHADHFENDRYVVTSAVGHLVEIKAPEAYDVKRGKWSFAHLPVVPPHFDLAPIDKAKSRLNAVVKLVKRKDVSELINACDAGREGELIFRLIVQYAGIDKKSAKPIRRLWLQSMTPQAIRDGFDELRSDAQMHGLADAARSRSEADWLVGINGTRAMTAFNSRDGGFFLTTVGRVQTPTLSIVVEREEKIRKHVARDYWEVKAAFLAQAGTYDGKWFDPKWKKNEDDPEARADRLWNEADARAIEQAVRGQSGRVSEESKPSTQSSPLLYDLTTLQREANGRFGFSAKTTLSLAQALYERHKALTYPRTDSRALPEDYLAVVKKTMAVLAEADLPGPSRELARHAKLALKADYVKPTKRVFDNAKVSDHFAIIPTLQTPTHLTEAEAKLYDLVVKRFIAVFYPPAEYLLTTRITTVGAHQFQTNGRVLVNPGWQAVYGKEAQDEDANLAPVLPDETVRNVEANVLALKTRPPARYSEATLLSAMEGAGKLIEDDELRAAMHDKGLGTPATRAAIIEGLIFEKYMHRDGRELVPTAKAFQLMTLLRGLDVEDLTKPELTGDWEYRLLEMEHGRLSRERVHEGGGRDGRAHRAQGQGVRPRHHPRRLRDAADAVPQLRRRGEGELPALRLRLLRVQHHQDPGRAQLRDRRGRGLPARQEDRPARGLSLEGGLAVLGRAAPGVRRRHQELEARVRLRRRRAPRAGRRRAGGLQRPDLARRPAPSARAMSTSTAPATCASTRWAPSRPATSRAARSSCSSRCAHEQMHKLLAGGRTDLLDGFVSNRTRRKFKAYLRYDPQGGQGGVRVRAAAAARCQGRTGRRRRSPLRRGCRRRRATAQGRGEEGRGEGGARAKKPRQQGSRQEAGGQEEAGRPQVRAERPAGGAPCRGWCCKSCWRCSSSSRSAGGPGASAGSARATPRACSATPRS